MNHSAISIRGLSKRYRIGSARPAYGRLTESLWHAIQSPLKRGNGHGNGGKDYIWALKDIDLDVQQGEVIGVIGRNGAGKTTLLKVLSRITEPTEGEIRLRGRVGSLLEVGTGFHPELTGRENVYLNGAVLGMRRSEIVRSFDEIVAFAEVEEFLDTPVKRYSTGMQMRLAFAVAAHLQPEILLVDEVLAVGDLAFQKKCLGKMEGVARGGRTVLFVSHQLNQIRRLSDRVVWIQDGGVKACGHPADVVAEYEQASISTPISSDRVRQRGNFVSWQIATDQDGASHKLSTLGRVDVRFFVSLARPINRGHHGVALFDNEGNLMWGFAVDGLNLPSGISALCHELPSLPLRPGVYRWRVSLYDSEGLIDVWDAIPDLVISTQPSTHPLDEWSGILNIPSDFASIQEPE